MSVLVSVRIARALSKDVGVGPAGLTASRALAYLESMTLMGHSADARSVSVEFRRAFAGVLV